MKKYVNIYYSKAFVTLSNYDISIDILNENEAHCRSYRFSLDDIVSVGYVKQLSHSWPKGLYFGQGLIVRTRESDNIVLKLELLFQYSQKEINTEEYVAFCRSMIGLVSKYNNAGVGTKIRIRNPVVWNPLLRTVMFAVSTLATLLLALPLMFVGLLVLGIQ